jgi:PEP-CTERM motif
MMFIKGSASLGAAMLIGLSAQSAQAGYVVDLTQVGGNVVATGSGAIDLTGLHSDGSGTTTAGLIARDGQIGTGPAFPAFPAVDFYLGIGTAPSFGSGDFTLASSGSGDLVEISNLDGGLAVPTGYVSDTPLSDTSTYDGATFASLGVTPGRYKWTWGSGADQNLTLVIGTVVPEPSTWAMMLLGFAVLGLAGYRVQAAATSNG